MYNCSLAATIVDDKDKMDVEVNINSDNIIEAVEALQKAIEKFQNKKRPINK